MSKVIKSISENINKNNTNGIFSIDGIKIFYKILNNTEFKMEHSGYYMIKKYYKVPNKYFEIKNNNKNIVGYEYYNTNIENKELLVSFFEKNNVLTKEYKNLLNMFSIVFNKTIKKVNSDNSHIFFEDRINTRLKNNIENPLIKKFDNKNYNINDNDIIINIYDCYNDVVKYYNKSNKNWCVISQCDPNDMNICIDGTIFDYTAGGFVPLMAEFAVFVCYNLVQCEYLSLLYNKNAFTNNKQIYKYINEVSIIDKKIKHDIRKIRIDAIISYIEIVINPILKKINYKNWYEDFKNYFFMKLLAVYNYNEMKEEDILLCLSYATLFYNKKFNTTKELIEFIKGLGDIYD